MNRLWSYPKDLKIYLLTDEYDSFSNNYMDQHNWQNSDESNSSLLVKDFGPTVNRIIALEYGIQKCFISGIWPICLANNTTGFNIAVNMSFKNYVAGLCGLTHDHVQAALEKVCPFKPDVVTHLEKLTRYANGYHFCRSAKTETLFNTDTCFEYNLVSFTHNWLFLFAIYHFNIY